MNKYAEVAINTAKHINKNGGEPGAVWEVYANKIFGSGTAASTKGCPKGAFLGLCEKGVINGIPKGRYTRSIKNKKNAIDAIELIEKNKEFVNDPLKLWEIVSGCGKTHNNQMFVVCELYKQGNIRKMD